MKTTFLCASIGAIAGTLLAGPIKRADVPGEPGWVLHLDVDGMRPTTVGKFLLAELNKPEADNKISSFEAMFGFDPRKALHGITIFNAGAGQENAVMLVYADFDAERLTKLARGARDYASVKHGKHVVHNWIDDKKEKALKQQGKEGAAPRTYAAITGNRVLFSERREALTKALDVIDGASTSLSQSKNYTDLGTGNAFLQASALKLDLPQSDPSAAIFRMAKAIRLGVSETNGKMMLQGTLDANNEEVAGNMTSIAQGMISLLKLKTDKPEEAIRARVAEALKVQQNGSTLNISMAVPSTDVVEYMKADAARRAAKATKE